MRSTIIWIALPIAIAVAGAIIIMRLAGPISRTPPASAPAASQESAPAPHIPSPPAQRTYKPQTTPDTVTGRSTPQPTTVYIAGQSGKRYHATRTCRGLTNARSIQAIPLAEAKRRGLTPCKICY